MSDTKTINLPDYGEFEEVEVIDGQSEDLELDDDQPEQTTT